MASKVNDEVASESVSVELVINENQSALSKSTDGASTMRERRTSIFTLGNKSWQMKSRRERIRRNKNISAIFGTLNTILHFEQLGSFRGSTKSAIFVVFVFISMLPSAVLLHCFTRIRLFCGILKRLTCIMVCGGTCINIDDAVFRSQPAYSTIYLILRRCCHDRYYDNQGSRFCRLCGDVFSNFDVQSYEAAFYSTGEKGIPV